LISFIVRILRAFFILLLLVIPVPVGQLFYRLLEGRRKNEATKVVKKEQPD
jgi:small neutral amino acid transporter SnatA (MarC family)